jgi:hypothetical protein
MKKRPFRNESSDPEMTQKRLQKASIFILASQKCDPLTSFLFIVFLFTNFSSVRPAEGKRVANDATQSRCAPASSATPPPAATAAASQVLACFVGGVAVAANRGTTGQEGGCQCRAKFKRSRSIAETARNGRISAEDGRNFNRAQDVRTFDAFESDRREGPQKPKKVRINSFDQLIGHFIFA